MQAVRSGAGFAQLLGRSAATARACTSSVGTAKLAYTSSRRLPVKAAVVVKCAADDSGKRLPAEEELGVELRRTRRHKLSDVISAAAVAASTAQVAARAAEAAAAAAQRMQAAQEAEHTRQAAHDGAMAHHAYLQRLQLALANLDMYSYCKALQRKAGTAEQPPQYHHLGPLKVRTMVWQLLMACLLGDDGTIYVGEEYAPEGYAEHDFNAGREAFADQFASDVRGLTGLPVTVKWEGSFEAKIHWKGGKLYCKNDELKNSKEGEEK